MNLLVALLDGVVLYYILSGIIALFMLTGIMQIAVSLAVLVIYVFYVGPYVRYGIHAVLSLFNFRRG